MWLVIIQYNNSLVWKKHIEITGGTTFNLPEKYSELHIRVSNTASVVEFTFSILKEDLKPDKIRGFLSGFSSSTNTLLGCRLDATSTSMHLSSVDVNGTNYVNSSIIEVYYR